MKLRRKVGLFAAICGVVFFGARSCDPVQASAAQETRVLTPAQTRALLGDALDFEYYDGTDYVTGQLNYLSSTAVLQTVDKNYFQHASGQRELFESIVKPDSQYVVYYGNFPDMVVSQGTYYTCQITPRIDFSGVTLTQFVAGFSCAPDYAPRMDSVPHDKVTYFVNGNQVQNINFWQNPSSTGGYRYETNFEFRVGNTLGRYFTLAPVNYDSDSQAIISNITFSRDGVVDVSSSGTGGLVRFIIQCPTLSVNGSVSGSGGSVGGDLTATNIKLDTIISLLSQIAAQEQGEDDSDNFDDDSPVFDMPDWFDDALDSGTMQAQVDIALDGSPIFGLVAENETDDPYLPSAGGQVFLPDGVNTPKIPDDPSNGGVQGAFGVIFALLNSVLKTCPILSKLIVIFLGASIASWAIFRGRGG